ncbi:MAG: TIGR00730 family Rossman fold protein [Bdellovibrionales bacterium]|nr:TIGR00730 family Rossman fold protein [Bdellovibrionales bacterium]
MNICIFCSSKSELSPSTFQQADAFCDTLVDKGHGFVYGGGLVGLMGHMADRVLDNKGEAYGVMPEGLFENEVAHPNLTKMYMVEDLMARKRKMMELSDSFVIFPGGIGTLDEAIEVMTWKSIKGFDKKIIFFNWEGFWDPVMDMLKHYEDQKVFYPETMACFKMVSTVDEIFKELES